MAFIQDPRMRQRWNQISHTTEAVTENAAESIWTFGHRYINPCLESVGRAVDSCMGPCIGDREERARRARERDRGARRTRAEYPFDFYDDWDDYGDYYDDGTAYRGDGETAGGGWASWGPRSEDWDRLLAGTGASKRHHGHGIGAEGGVEVEQPRRKRGMSYGTRGPRRKNTIGAEEDPNVIPRTAPLGFLGRLPFKIVGSLRYKPSAANLRDNPGGTGGAQQYRGGTEEYEPLLGGGGGGGGGGGDGGIGGQQGRKKEQRNRTVSSGSATRSRSNTTESGDTSSSFRSRGDLFPSDGEGDEDAVPLDEEEFTVALDRVGDDRASNKTGSSKGKRPADSGNNKGLSRTGSRTTIYSGNFTPDENKSVATSPFPELDDREHDHDADATSIEIPSLEELQQEEERIQREEDAEIEKRRRAASRLALQRGLSGDDPTDMPGTVDEQPVEEQEDAQQIQTEPKPFATTPLHQPLTRPEPVSNGSDKFRKIKEAGANDQSQAPQFVPARLPHFG